MTAKEIIKDIIEAHCLYSQNQKKVMMLADINSAEIYNGGNDYYQIIDKILNKVSEEKAKEIVNQMPFPFMQHYYPTEEPTQNILNKIANLIDYNKRDSFWWIENVLSPLRKKGEIKSKITHCGIINK